MRSRVGGRGSRRAIARDNADPVLLPKSLRPSTFRSAKRSPRPPAIVCDVGSFGGDAHARVSCVLCLAGGARWCRSAPGAEAPPLSRSHLNRRSRRNIPTSPRRRSLFFLRRFVSEVFLARTHMPCVGHARQHERAPRKMEKRQKSLLELFRIR